MIQPDRQPLAAQEDVADVPRLSTDLPDDQFRARWLAEACRSIEGVSAGCLLLAEDDAVTETLWPEGCEAAPLRRAADRAGTEGREVVLWTRADTGSPQQGSGGLGAFPGGSGLGSLGMGIIVACPLPSRGSGTAVVALSLSPRPGLDAKQVVDSLHRSGGWIEARAGLRTVVRTQARCDGLAAALDVVLTAGEDPRLRFSAAALANDLALRFACDRVAVGIVQRGRVRVRGLSHLGTALRRSELVTAIESAMEEATDQHEAIVYPPLPERRRRLDGAHRALARTAEAAGVMSVPLRAGGEVVGAVCFERRGAEGFGPANLQQAEAVAALLGPTVALQARADRWLSGRVRDLSETTLHALFGPAHPTAKLAVVVAGLVAAALVLVDGTHRVTAKATTEGIVQRAAAAPFDGFVLSAPARAGDTVRRGDVLAVLDDRDLLLEQAKWRSELEKSRQKYHEAFSKRERPAVTAAAAQIKGAQAQLDLVDEKLRRTRITAPFDGVVVSGDYSQLLGSPVEKGKTLFEIAPSSDHRVVMQVDERDLRHVAAGQAGHLVLTGMPSRPLPLAVSKVTPVASVEDGRNVFRVEASLAASPDGEAAVALRPGLEGVAKVEVGKRSLAWIWTHGLWDWLRLAAWKWLP